jgi:uncharacterized protein YbjQ (UPF0145 family)
MGGGTDRTGPQAPGAAAATGSAEARGTASGSGLPEAAQRRIAEIERPGGSWGSSLSVAELASIKRAGFEPLGLAVGSSIYQLTPTYTMRYPAWTGPSAGFSKTYPCPHGYGYGIGHLGGLNWEQVYYEEGVEEAYRLALGRLVEEARELGAHGVVGVTVRFRHLSSYEGQASGRLVEFTVVGTAVRCPGAAPLEEPFTSHLSGQGLAKLVAAGLVPASLALGCGAIQVLAGCQMTLASRSFANVELTQYSEAIDQCRWVAVRRLEAMSGHTGEGVIGVDVNLAGGGDLTEMMLLGTSVRRFSTSPLPSPPLPIMKLRDR